MYEYVSVVGFGCGSRVRTYMAAITRQPKRRALSSMDYNAFSHDNEAPYSHVDFNSRGKSRRVEGGRRQQQQQQEEEETVQENSDREAASAFVKSNRGIQIQEEDNTVMGWLEATFHPFRKIPLRIDQPTYLGRSLKMGVQSASIPSKQIRIEATRAHTTSSSSVSIEERPVVIEARTLGVNPCSIQRHRNDHPETANSNSPSPSSGQSALSPFFPGRAHASAASPEDTSKQTASHFLLPQQCTSMLHVGDILYLTARHHYGFRILGGNEEPLQQNPTSKHPRPSDCHTPTNVHTKDNISGESELSLSPRCTVLGRVQRRCIEARRSGTALEQDVVDENGAVHSRFFSPCRSSNGSQSALYENHEEKENAQQPRSNSRAQCSPGTKESVCGNSPDRIFSRHKCRRQQEKTKADYIVCSICQETEMMTRGQLPCSHSFCFDCISAWSKVSNTCCLCKQPFEKIVKRSPSGQYLETVNVEPRQYRHEDQDDAVLEEEFEGCMVCDGLDYEAQMLLCDRCDGAYHTFCLTPPLWSIPEGAWFCPPCTDERMELLRHEASLARDRQNTFRREEAYERLRRRCQGNQLVILDSDDEED